MYDIIGNIHGHADELVVLLEMLGYDRTKGSYSHPSRKAIFLGNFIDRGPAIRGTLEIVHAMVTSGAAFAVMGVHEYNALAYHTRDARNPNEFLRPHSRRNVREHLQTLTQLSPAELTRYLDWFRTLPLWLDLRELRVVQACWDEDSVRVIRSRFPDGRLSSTALYEAQRGGTAFGRAVETVLEGCRDLMSDRVTIEDSSGNEIHVKWYQASSITYTDVNAVATSERPPAPARRARPPAEYPPNAKPVFFGRYWQAGEVPAVIALNAVSLTSTSSTAGQLCAYRWQGETGLTDEHFVTTAAELPFERRGRTVNE